MRREPYLHDELLRLGCRLLPLAGHETVATGRKRTRLCRHECRSVSPTRERLVTVGGPELHSAGVVTVTFNVLTTTNHALYQAIRPARVEKVAPNGVKCGAVCYEAAVKIDPRTASLTTNAREIRSLLMKHLMT